jgi:hypothetical protein
MTPTSVARLAAATLTLGIAFTDAAAEEQRRDSFGFFENDRLSFERTDQPETTPAPPPPSAAPQPHEGRGEPHPLPAVAVPSDGAARHAPPPLSARPAAPPPAPPGRSDRSVEVLRVRELTADERAAMKAVLRCSDPLAAEVRLGERLRAVLAEVTRLGTNRLPETVSWVFGRAGRCFDRPGGLAAQELDLIDEAARRAAPPKGAK